MRVPVVLSKRPLVKLANKVFGYDEHLPKKGFVVPMTRDANAKMFFESLPTQMDGFELSGVQRRYAAHAFAAWTKNLGIRQQAS